MRTARYMIVTLGCFRNEVESDLIRSAMASLGMAETRAVEGADLLIVNTCGFISEACDESIDTILELADISSAMPARPPMLVLGCMAQRYGSPLMREMPEIDGILGSGWGSGLGEAVEILLAGGKYARPPGLPGGQSLERVVDSSEDATLLVRIADGCDRACRFCTIPSIRGRYSSRSPEEVCDEIERLSAGRQREVILLAQDLTGYGSDGVPGADLPGLIRKISEAQCVRWLRLLYLQPEGITDALLDEMTGNSSVCDYFDIPFQHASGSVLRRMGRPGDAESHMELLSSIRARSPEASLRTTVMVGYPGETDAEFEELKAFVEQAKFDWMGAFVFSAEEGVAASAMPGQVAAEVAVSRYDTIVEVQEKVEESALDRFAGRTLEVVIDGFSEIDGYELVGRSYREAPVVDGVVHLRRRSARSSNAVPGEFHMAQITGNEGLDLAGEI